MAGEAKAGNPITERAKTLAREAFVKRWRNHLAGMALFGFASDRNEGTLERSKRIWEIPADVEKLLGAMFDDLSKEGKA